MFSNMSILLRVLPRLTSLSVLNLLLPSARFCLYITSSAVSVPVSCDSVRSDRKSYKFSKVNLTLNHQAKKVKPKKCINEG